MTVSPRHAFAVWRRNATMYRRTWMLNILPNFFEPVLYLLAIGLGVGAYVSEMGGTTYTRFLAPGLVCVAAMNGASFEVTYNIFVRLVYEKQYDAMLTTPVQPDDVLAGEVLWALTRAAIYGGSFLVILVLWGLASVPAAIFMLPVIALAGLLFASLGVAVTLRLPSIELFSFYFTLFLTPLFLFSDVFFPLKERLSGIWLWVAEVLPLLHPVRIARMVFRGDPSPVLLWDVLYILVASGLLLASARAAVHRRLTS